MWTGMFRIVDVIDIDVFWGKEVGLLVITF
jgi:hypothetical protein